MLTDSVICSLEVDNCLPLLRSHEGWIILLDYAGSQLIPTLLRLPETNSSH